MDRASWIGGGTGGSQRVGFWCLVKKGKQVLTDDIITALDQIAIEEPFALRETPPEGFAPSPKERLGL